MYAEKRRQYEKNTTCRYGEFHGMVLFVPRVGTDTTTLWYSEFHAVVRAIPCLGTDSFMRWNK
ncbi:hypothetical protein DW989_09875 [Bacteroides stercoris]|uniref:Uncharacterized protein n=1 Tax=Bacteroides stercoris TaxID=46506 RepID=A0A7J5LB12_BACSE|nr:hypothetical protein F9953_15675 [Bacteroides stercoris]KAB5289127.1 hypothetical protein F9945_16165 [Bacteroides stercoris]KAB5297185.1 hypothetical protein F9955_11940 [Bacteroides stercoris]KAB5298021.1 hypothetical protein F9942_15430 [Bacteroides stercoris]KAB5298745.1 hypothetical protein F9991_16075 [Bacteroides stercoris]